MSIATQLELTSMQKVNQAVAQALKKMCDYAQPGMSTKELDDYGYSLLRLFGARSAPKLDYGFPGHTCISINHEVCHGIPSHHKILKEGDLVNIDVSAELNGFYGDNGCSFILGKDIQGLQPLVDASREILYIAISRIKNRVKIADIGGLISMETRKRGYRVIKNICGHGIGRALHEAPTEIPCYRDRLLRGRFRKNMVIALETFISTNAKKVYQKPDGWTLATRDRSFVAQHEHTLVVTGGYPILLTQGNGI